MESKDIWGWIRIGSLELTFSWNLLSAVEYEKFHPLQVYQPYRPFQYKTWVVHFPGEAEKRIKHAIFSQFQQ